MLSKTTPGLTHLLLSSSIAITPFAALSRPITGIRQTTLIITFPGSPKACKENLSAILGVLPHGLDLLRGETRQHGERHGSNSSHAHQILSDRHHGHSCKHRSEENSEHKGRSLPLDTPGTSNAKPATVLTCQRRTNISIQSRCVTDSHHTLWFQFKRPKT